MEWFPPSKDHLPLTWWKQTPVYLAAVIALAGVASMVLTSILTAIDPSLPTYLTFSLNSLLHGWIWTPITYVLVNPPSIWFIIASYMIWNFGEAVERHIGRWSFVKLLICLVLASPLLLTVMGLLGVGGWGASGLWKLEFGIFLAFATLYPTAKLCLPFLGEIEARLLAAIFVAIAALSDLSNRDWAGLFVLAGEVATAVGYIRYEQGALTLPTLNLWPKKAPQAKRAKPTAGTKASGGPRIVDLDDVDDILEKISRHGIGSLTETEKRTLEKASDHLSKRGRSGR